MSTVCAIILDYFGSKKTISCLSSLTDQGLDTALIIDNSGNEQANLKLKEALAEFQKDKMLFTIHHIINKQNLGYAKGVNHALRWLDDNQPHSHYLIINNDAKATPGMLPKLLEYMKKNNHLALASPVINTGQTILSEYWYQRSSGMIFSYHIPGTFPYLTGCCLLVDQRVVSDGLFDEDFFIYGEDVELCYRLHGSGWDTVCVSEALVLHEGTGSSHQGDFFYEYHVARGHMILARKLAVHVWETPFLYLGRLLTLSVRSIVRAIRFRSFVPIKAWVSALRKNNDMTR